MIEVKTENKHLALSVKALEAVYIVRMDKMDMIFFKMIVSICEFHSGFSGKDVAYLDVFCMHMPRIISEFYYICTYGYVICIIYVLFHVIHHTLVINGIKKYQKLSFLLFIDIITSVYKDENTEMFKFSKKHQQEKDSKQGPIKIY